MNHLLRAEALRLRTVPTPLLACVLVLLAVAGLMTALSAAAPAPDAPAIMQQGLTLCATLCGLTAALLGALGASTDFQHGTAVTAFLSRPRRRDVLLARASVHAALGATLGAGGALAALLVGLATAQARGVEVGDFGPPWLVAAVAVGTGAAGALGVAAGMWMRSPVASVLTIIGAVTIVEPVLGSFLPAFVLPFSAFGVLAAGQGLAAAGIAAALLTAWTAVLLVLAGRSVSRTDIGG